MFCDRDTSKVCFMTTVPQPQFSLYKLVLAPGSDRAVTHLCLFALALSCPLLPGKYSTKFDTCWFVFNLTCVAVVTVLICCTCFLNCRQISHTLTQQNYVTRQTEENCIGKKKKEQWSIVDPLSKPTEQDIHLATLQTTVWQSKYTINFSKLLQGYFVSAYILSTLYETCPSLQYLS